jgi:hypothetical protein
MSQMELVDNYHSEMDGTPAKSMDGSQSAHQVQEYVERTIQNEQEIKSTHDTVQVVDAYL